MKNLVFVLLLVSCNYKIDKTSDGTRVQPTQETTQSISYEKVKEQVFLPKCISCHGSQGGVNLESYALAKSHLAEIERAALQTKSMPKSPISPLNRRQLELLTAWIDAGAPENARSGGSTNDDDSNSNNFESLKKSVLLSKCILCHKGGEEAEKIPFETKEQILNSRIKLVITRKPEQSLLYTITAPGARDMMPPYPMPPLKDEERELIKKWISNDAQ